MSFDWGSFGGSLLGWFGEGQDSRKARHSAEDQAIADRTLQEDSLKHGISWRVADAKAAGIHPLAALGANVSTPAPTAVGVPPPNRSHYLAQAGQALFDVNGRKLVQLQLEQEKEKLENMKLENVGLRMQIEQASKIPVFDNSLDSVFGIPGQVHAAVKGATAGGPGYEFKDVILPKSSKLGVTAGIGPMNSKAINEDGTVYKVLSQNLQDALENDWYAQTKYFIANIVRLGRNLTGAGIGYGGNWGPLTRILKKERPKAPDGYEYRWNILRDAFVLRKRRGVSRFYDHEGINVPYSGSTKPNPSFRLKSRGASGTW